MNLVLVARYTYKKYPTHFVNDVICLVYKILFWLNAMLLASWEQWNSYFSYIISSKDHVIINNTIVWLATYMLLSLIYHIQNFKNIDIFKILLLSTLVKITILFIDLFDHNHRDNFMSSPNKKRTYVYNSPHKVREDENVSSESMNILNINTENDKFPFKNGGYDLEMFLLGEGKTRFDVIQCKLLLSRLGGHLDRRCFIRAVFYKVIFNTRHCVQRKRS